MTQKLLSDETHRGREGEKSKRWRNVKKRKEKNIRGERTKKRKGREQIR